MGTTKKVAGTLALVLFFGILALRPLLANPAISGAFSGGGWQTLLVVPLVLVAVVVVALRIRSAREGPEEWEIDQQKQAVQANSWADRTDAESDGDSDEGESGNDEHATQSEQQSSVQSGPSILAGQGGTRNRDFEIEEVPPESHLSDHLEHLRSQLGDERHHATELDTLEQVVEEVEGDRKIPARCPHDHCEARWSDRGVLGMGRRQFELLEDGKTAVCLECEQSYELPEPAEDTAPTETDTATAVDETNRDSPR